MTIDNSTETCKSLLICGDSGAGKTSSLRHLPNQEKVLYCNCDGGKNLPYRNNFRRVTVTDPLQLFNFFDGIQSNPDKYDVIVIDTLNLAMEMWILKYIKGVPDTRSAWGEYADFFRTLMLDYVAKSTATTIFLAHTESTPDPLVGLKTRVPIKGSLKNAGIEAYFTTVINTVKAPIDLTKPNALLDITEDEEEDGFKHMFQTRTTINTLGDKIRAPIGMFSRAETYIDNDVAPVIQRFKEFYSA